MRKMRYAFILFSLVSFILSIYFVNLTYGFGNKNNKNESVLEKIRQKYQNQDIIALLQIDNLLNEPIANSLNENNTSVKLFLESFDSNYLKIYSDNLLELENYLMDFYIYENSYLTIQFDNEIYKYLVFSVGIVSKEVYDNLELNQMPEFLEKDMLYNLNLGIDNNDYLISLIASYSKNNNSYLLINGIRFF